jgi:hypothetical protein
MVVYTFVYLLYQNILMDAHHTKINLKSDL